MSTFSQQQKIPRLPIPTLEETSKRYLLSLQPLLSGNEYTHAEGIVNDFIKPNGLGQTLQKRLQDYDLMQKVKSGHWQRAMFSIRGSSSSGLTRRI